MSLQQSGCVSSCYYFPLLLCLAVDTFLAGPKPYRSATDSRCWVAIKWKEFSVGEHSWPRLVKYTRWQEGVL